MATASTISKWVSIAAGVAAVVAVIYTWSQDSGVRAEGNTKARIAQAMTDTLQWRTIMETKQNIGNCHRRIDSVTSDVNTIHKEISEINQNLDDVKVVLRYICRKLDKNLELLLKDRVDNYIRVEDISNPFIEDSTGGYTYIDTLTVKL